MQTEKTETDKNVTPKIQG